MSLTVSVVSYVFSPLPVLLVALYMVELQRLKELFFQSTHPFINCSLRRQGPSVAFLSFELSAVPIKSLKLLVS